MCTLQIWDVSGEGVPNDDTSLFILIAFFLSGKVFPTELRNSGINIAAVVSMVVGMSAPYAIDLVSESKKSWHNVLFYVENILSLFYDSLIFLDMLLGFRHVFLVSLQAAEDKRYPNVVFALLGVIGK
jgi:hypothetical protein